jgi:hypothetical protein
MKEDMIDFSTTTERVAFLTENYDINENCAKALILSEMGFSSNGIAKVLQVTTSTSRKYLKQLENEIGENVTEALPKSVRYPTFPGDTVEDPEYAGDHIEYEPQFKDQELPVNKGKSLEEIDNDLITIRG